MAEAVVESPVPSRFYCHMCNVEINIPNTEFTCPLCAGGFVEELPRSAPPTPSASTNNAGGPSNNMDVGGGGMPWVRAADLEDIRREIVSLITNGPGPNVEISIDPGSRRGNLLTLGGGSSDAAPSVMGGGRVRPQHLDRLDNVLLDFLQTLSQTGNGGDVDMEGGAGAGPFGANHMFFMGNPGDYAWGREGIDTIVTQLLNQMETSGPPPLAKDKIAEIPKVAVSKEEVDEKLQCSVCWEDFNIDEEVRKLPCSHIYHENCIVPWLDLHGTCPICRKSLIDDTFPGEGDVSDDSFSTSTGGPNLGGAGVCPLHRNLLNSAPAASSSSAAAPSSSSSSSDRANRHSQQQQQPTERSAAPSTNIRNNVFGFDDDADNVDLD